jgi:hypothetical protein
LVRPSFFLWVRPVSIKVQVEVGDFSALAEQAAARATEVVAGELFAAFQQSFTAKAWPWPRALPTRQLKGATVAEKAASYNRGEGTDPGSPRNLIDTGNLRQSGTWQMTGRFEATYTWNASYALAIHDGAMIFPWGRRDVPRVQLPARPWTRAVLAQENVPGIEVYDVGQRLKDVWLQQLRR